jgi:DNA repair exonuclease SbcCD ATPase subunit
MTKSLRALVIMNFLLGGVVLYMAIVLFNDREVLKVRTLRLEDGIMDMSAFIEEEQVPDLEAQDGDKFTVNPSHLQTIFRLDPNDPDRKTIWKDPVSGLPTTEGPGTTDEVLDALLDKTVAQYERLNETRQGLRVTRLDLERTQQTLEQTEQRLLETENRLNNAHGEIVRLGDVIREKDSQLAQNAAEITDLKNQIDYRINELTGKKDEIAQLRSKNAFLMEELERMGGGREGSKTDDALSGLKGSVTAVSDEWRFIIFEARDLDTLTQLAKDTELTIARGSLPIGKVKVAKVDTKSMRVVCDVTALWANQRIHQGDMVVF